jgi:protein-S-isoprenylcysteine O-methyltransferase Ste14
MDPINIIAGINFIATFAANLPGSRKGLKSSVVPSKVKPKTYLQSFPLVLATLNVFFILLGLFEVGTFTYANANNTLRLVCLVLYIVFSWIQILASRTLGDNYSQNILIYKSHRLIQTGPYKYIRHPQYLGQIIADLGAGFALLSFLIIPIAVLEIPIFILRAKAEDKMLLENFKEEFSNYKKKSGFMLPFIG